MSENIDPKILFDLIAHHLPTELHQHVLIAGSLAAAYHHRDRLIGGVINTKDADVVIQPAGAVSECERVAKLLLARGCPGCIAEIERRLAARAAGKK